MAASFIIVVAFDYCVIADPTNCPDLSELLKRGLGAAI